MAILVDARGKACPQPVVETKKAIQSANGETVVILVDNDIACRNLEMMAKQMGLPYVSEQKDGDYQVTIGGTAISTESCPVCEPLTFAPTGKTVVILSSNTMGAGDDTLGAALMKGFVYALTQLDKAPDTVLMYNGGAKLSAGDSESVADLKVLEANGTEVLTCGTCLNHYGLTDKLAVGSVTNMYVIAETMMKAGKVIRP